MALFNQNRDRFYTIQDTKLVSVTTVLNIVAKDALPPWYARQERNLIITSLREALAEKAPGDVVQVDNLVETVERIAGKKKAGDREKAKAAKRGKTAHTAIECALRGDTMPPLTDADQRLFDAWWTWWKATGFVVLDVEKVVFDMTLGYAGTMDVRAKHNKHGIVVLDWKSGKNIYSEAYLQNVAYRAAGKTMGLDSDMGAVIRLTYDGPVVGVCDDNKHTMKDFEAALNLWTWRHRNERN